MAYSKITAEDLQNKGVIGLADVPALDTARMQEKFEETARGVIVPKFNALVDSLCQRDNQVDARLDQRAEKADTYTKRQVDSIAAGKADRSDTYTKAETEDRIDQKVREIGSADMTKAEYATDSYGVVKRAEADADGNNIAQTYATVTEMSQTYLPLTGGTIAGTLTNNGTTYLNGTNVVNGVIHLNNNLYGSTRMYVNRSAKDKKNFGLGRDEGDNALPGLLFEDRWTMLFYENGNAVMAGPENFAGGVLRNILVGAPDGTQYAVRGIIMHRK